METFYKFHKVEKQSAIEDILGQIEISFLNMTPV
jgi:hypothetical protein